MNSRELIQKLQDAGWRLESVRGSHHKFKHPERPGHVVVPHPKKDLPAGTVRNILRQAGIDPRSLS